MVNLDEWYIDNLSPACLGFVLKIVRFMKANRMTAWPSIATLERVCGWSEDTVKKYRGELVDKGILGIEYRPGLSPVYTFLKPGIGLYFGVENTPVSEEGGEKLPPLKITPPKNYPGGKLPPEDITNTLEDITNTGKDITDIVPPAAKAKTKTKKVTPGPPHTIRLMAEMFDAKLVEKGERKFTWKAGEARNFKALNDLKGIIEKEITAAGKVELNDENFTQAYGYVLEYGFQYLFQIAQKRGGAIEFKPSALLNNYNAIINHARQQHKRVIEAHEVRRRTEQWNDYDDD